MNKKYKEEIHYYIYEITCLINGMKYIGKRKCHGPIEKDGYMGSGILIQKAIKKHGRKNFVKEIIEECESEEIAYKREAEIIAERNAYKGRDYYNINSGGIGACGYVPSAEAIKKSLETKKKNGTMPCGEKNPMYGRKYGESKQSRSVVAIKNNGDVIHFDSMSRAKDFLGIEKANSAISHVCILGGGKRYGYVWCFKEDYEKYSSDGSLGERLKEFEDKELYINEYFLSPVYLIDKETGDIIKEFQSVIDAGKCFDIMPSSIVRNIKHGCNTVKGYSFILKEEYEKLNKKEVVELYKKKKAKHSKPHISSRKAVYCITTNQKFDSIQEAEEYFGIKRCVSKACRGQRATAGKHPETGEGLKWAYYDDYLSGNTPCREDKSKKKIICISKTKEILPFNSITQAECLLEDGFNIKSAGKICNKGGGIYGNYLWFSEKDYEFYKKNGLLKEKIEDFLTYMEYREKYLLSPIYSINKTTADIYEEFQSVVDASKKLNIYQSQILSVLKHESNMVNGYTFFYKNEYEKLTKEDILKIYQKKPSLLTGRPNVLAMKPVYCITLNQRFNSIKEAREFLNMPGINISLACSGKYYSAGKHPETGEKLRWVYYEDYLNGSIPDCIEPQKRSIIQYSADGELIKKYKDVKEVEKMGFSYSGVLGSCAGRTKTSAGFVWRYEGDDFFKWNTKRSKHSRIVRQYDLNGNFIREYESINSTNKHGFNSGSVTMCCDGARESYKGYIWKYAPGGVGPKKKGIIQYNTDGELLKKYTDIKEIEKMGFSHSGVLNSCAGRTKTSAGFVWRYEGDDFSKWNTKKSKYPRIVRQYDLNGNFIREYESMNSTNKHGFRSDAVTMCCDGARGSYKGYIWKYAPD